MIDTRRKWTLSCLRYENNC